MPPRIPAGKADEGGFHTYKILAKRVLTPVTKLFLVSAPVVAEKAEPGQFVMLRLRAQGERIPLTIADFDREAGTVTILVQEIGLTSRLLGALEEGDEILDLVGPLGLPAELPTAGHVVCVGGGFGVAPILPKAKLLHRRGVAVTSIIGARTADLVIFDRELEAVSNRLLVATNDGSRGRRGIVTDCLRDLLEAGEQIDEVVAIGPMVMMRAVAEATRPYGIKTLVSMNPIMVDGTGMCGACRMTVGGEVKFACVDGPIFDGHQVDFEEAIRRSQAYRAEEELATKHEEAKQCR